MALAMRAHGGCFKADARRAPLTSLRTPCALQAVQRQRQAVVVRADNGRDSNFLAGFVVGGVVMGTLGFLFAPQISKALLGDDQRLKLPRFLEEEDPKTPEQTKQDLIEKIAQLNASIDEVAAQLKVKEGEPLKMESSS